MCEHCDGCNAQFTVEHALGCKKGSLVVQRHDDTRDEAGALDAMALTTSHVTYEPYIFHDRDVSATLRADEVQDAAVSADEEARGDVAIHGLWEKGNTCILDIRITDTDAKAHFAHSLEKVLEKAAKEKKKYITMLVWRVGVLSAHWSTRLMGWRAKRPWPLKSVLLGSSARIWIGGTARWLALFGSGCA